MGYRTWRYHPRKQARIFDSDNIPDGWYDTPAKFPKEKELGQMSKGELEEYCKEKYGVDLDRRYSTKKMLAKINKLGG